MADKKLKQPKVEPNKPLQIFHFENALDDELLAAPAEFVCIFVYFLSIFFIILASDF